MKILSAVLVFSFAFVSSFGVNSNEVKAEEILPSSGSQLDVSTIQDNSESSNVVLGDPNPSETPYAEVEVGQIPTFDDANGDGLEDGPDGENNADEVIIEINELSNEQYILNALDAGSGYADGTYYFYTQSLVMTSDGGNVTFDMDNDIRNDSSPGMVTSYTLYEDDGATGDDTVGSWEYTGYNPYSFDIDANSYVDGTDNQAEFYMVKTQPNFEASCIFWD